MLFLIAVALFAIVGTSVLLYIKYLDTYWERRGFFQYRSKRKGENVLLETYKVMKKSGLKYAGYVKYYRPNLIIRDFDVIKMVMIKDADHFINRGMYYNEKNDPFSATLPKLENELWKNIRSIVSPIFSSGKLNR